MGYWKKHQQKDLGELLCEFDKYGWRIDDPPKYYRVRCPCPERHMRWIHLTPSNPRYANEVRAWLHRLSCKQEER